MVLPPSMRLACQINDNDIIVGHHMPKRSMTQQFRADLFPITAPFIIRTVHRVDKISIIKIIFTQGPQTCWAKIVGQIQYDIPN